MSFKDGLFDSADLIGIGTTIVSGVPEIAETTIKSDIPCRLTLRSRGEDEKEHYRRDHPGGKASIEFNCVLEYTPEITDAQSYFILLDSIRYRILWFRHYRDRFGAFHHTTVFMEKEK